MVEIASIILAAGASKRMRTRMTKVLLPVAGRPMLSYVLAAAKEAGAKKQIVVSRPLSPELQQFLKQTSGLTNVIQPTPKGTGDAVHRCKKVMKLLSEYTLVLCGDTPLLQGAVLKDFVQSVTTQKATLGLLTTEVEDPTGYGRIVRDPSGQVKKIVEEKETSATEKKICEINTGIYCFRTQWLFEKIPTLQKHPAGEYFLTDLLEKAVSEQVSVTAVKAEDADDYLGVNTQRDLALADHILRERVIAGWLEKGVRFLDPWTAYIDFDVTLGSDVVIYPQVYLFGQTKIGNECVIEAGSVIRDSVLGEKVHVKPYCVIESSTIGDAAQVGPFARLRPETELEEGVRVGNFVEIKKSRLKKGAKANHLSYIGDAVVGEATNIGCGTITCNYDGVKKHKTIIGKRVFVGSDVQFVAPVKIGDDVVIGAGSTITDDVPSKALAVARARQTVKKNWKRKKRR